MLIQRRELCGAGVFYARRPLRRPISYNPGFTFHAFTPFGMGYAGLTTSSGYVVWEIVVSRLADYHSSICPSNANFRVNPVINFIKFHISDTFIMVQ